MRRLTFFIMLCSGCRTDGTLASICTETSECSAGLFCVAGACSEVTCTDAIKDGNETGIDCGGSCGPCASGADCNSGADCASRVCADGQCAAPSCNDALANGNETDVDCGGGCGPCTQQKKCKLATDCQSDICSGGTCVAAACTDGVQNEGESDVDCGGNACRACTPGQKCGAASDCDSGVCGSDSVCAAPSCDDSVKNGSETDVDCGGSCDSKCENGKACTGNDDCSSDVCSNGVCVDCVGARDCLRGSQSAQCVSYTCEANACKAQALTPTQTPNDCQQLVCNADYSLSPKADATDHEADQNGDCYAYACDSCTATSCQKVVVFQPNDTPPQSTGDCHENVCVSASPLPHAVNVVDDSDVPTGDVPAACFGAATCQNGSVVFPVNQANVPPSSCPTDYCDAAGNLHKNPSADVNTCSELNSCAAGVVDGCGFTHDCHQEGDPCASNQCGTRWGSGACANVAYGCPITCNTGDVCSAAQNNTCVYDSGGGSPGGGGCPHGITCPGLGKPCFCTP